LKERWRVGQKRREDLGKDVSSYRTTLGKSEDTGNRRRKHYIARCGELALLEAMDLSSDRQQ
jgi:hypothetical protein